MRVVDFGFSAILVFQCFDLNTTSENLRLTLTGQYKTFLLENRVSVLKAELTKLTTGSSKSSQRDMHWAQLALFPSTCMLHVHGVLDIVQQFACAERNAVLGSDALMTQ